MRGNSANIVSLAAIVVVSALLGTFVSWRAPGIDQYMRDWMIRARGPLPAPDDIAIVAIDEPSIARFGRFPWSRALSARAIDAIAAAQPKAIAVDVLYADPTSETDDSALARSIQQAGNVVVAAQLVAPPAAGGPTSWLLPLPAIERAAAAVGHVNVSTESDGVARQILIRAADDQGRAIRAMAVESIRIGDGIAEQSMTETSRSLLLGSRVIPVESIAPSVVIGGVPGVESSTQTLRAARMAIDYIGPAGSYRTYSFADVVGRTHSASTVPRQIRACGRDSGLLGRSPRFALRSSSGRTGKSARVFDAGCRGTCEHAEHDLAIPFLFRNSGLARVSLRRAGGGAYYVRSRDRPRPSRDRQANWRSGGGDRGSLVGGLSRVHSFSRVSAADAVSGFIRLRWRARTVATVVGRKFPSRSEVSKKSSAPESP